jgi:deoxycytidylate deaminase
MEILAGLGEQEAASWMKEAAEVAKSARCNRAKCGSVIVSNGEIIGRGYNAPPLDQESHRMCEADRSAGKEKYDRTCCVHAEWRAIMDALRRNPDRLAGSKLYFMRIDEAGQMKKSGQPYCTVCSRLALDTGVGSFLLWHEEGIGEYPTDEYNRLSYEYRENN